MSAGGKALEVDTGKRSKQSYLKESIGNHRVGGAPKNWNWLGIKDSDGKKEKHHGDNRPWFQGSTPHSGKTTKIVGWGQTVG